MIRLGIIGCGRIVELAHAQALIQLRDLVHVAAIADVGEDRLARVGELLGVPQAHRHLRYEDLVEEPLDAVVIATPNDSHAGCASAAMLAGLDVISEKPLGRSVQEAEELVRLQWRTGTRLRVLHNYLYEKGIQKLLGLVAGGELGRVHGVALQHFLPGVFRGVWHRDPSWRLDPAVSGGGCLLDLGYHACYLAEAAAGSVVAEVGGHLDRAPAGGPEDYAVVVARHANGVISEMAVGWAVAAHHMQLDVRCAGGIARLVLPATLQLQRDGDRRLLHVGRGHGIVGAYAAAFSTALLDQPGSPAAASMDATRGLDVLRMLEAAYRSARSGKPVTVRGATRP